MAKSRYFMKTEEIEHLNAYKKGRLAFNKVLTKNNNEIYVFGVPRECVENGDAHFLEAILTFAIKNNYRNQIQLIFESYAEDEREITEIPEVVTYMQGLNDVFPGWIYFMSTDPELSALSTMLEMLVVYRKAISKRNEELITVSNEELRQISQECISGMNSLLTLEFPHNITVADIIQAQTEINKYIEDCIVE